MTSRFYLNHYAAPVNIYGGIEIRAALEEECEECDSSEPPVMQSTGSVFADLAGVEYSRGFTAFWYLNARGECEFQWDFDGYEWRVWDAACGYRAAGAEEIAALAAACLGEEYAGAGAVSAEDALGELATRAAGNAALKAAGDVGEWLSKLAAHRAALVDETRGRVELIPTWALPALANGDYSGLSEEDAAALDAWVEAQDDISVTRFDCANQDEDSRYYIPEIDEEISRSFEHYPAFGLPADCEAVFFPYA